VDTDQAVKGPWAAVGQARGSAAGGVARLGNNGSHLREKRLDVAATRAGREISKKIIGGPNIMRVRWVGREMPGEKTIRFLAVTLSKL
jgi:hypothetical protein